MENTLNHENLMAWLDDYEREKLAQMRSNLKPAEDNLIALKCLLDRQHSTCVVCGKPTLNSMFITLCDEHRLQPVEDEDDTI